MKKIFTIVAAAFMAASVNAQSLVHLINNSDLEGTDNTSFMSKESPSDEMLQATIYDGVGVDGSRGLKIVSAPASVGAGKDWDTQVWFVYPDNVWDGDVLHISFDYKASKAPASQPSIQIHGDPGSYSYWDSGVSCTFGTMWKTFSATITVTEAMLGSNGYRSLAFNLATDKDNEVTYYFDNIVVDLESTETGVDGVRILNDTDAPVYNLAGQKVDKSFKGVVIKNGKKFIQK